MPIDLKSKYISNIKNGKASEALEYFHELYYNMPMPSVIITQDYVIFEVSRQFLEVFDYERNEVIGKNILDFIVSEHKDIFLDSIKKLESFDSIVGVEFQMAKKDKTLIDVNLSAKIGNKYSEDSLVIFCIIEDITFKKSCVINLESKNLEMSLLLDNIEAHVWYLKDSETYGFVNKAHASFLGYSIDYLKNRNLNEFLPKEVAEICIKGNQEVFSKKKTIHTTEWAPNYKGQNRLIEVTKTPLLDSVGNVKYVVCIGSDITDKKKMQKKN